MANAFSKTLDPCDCGWLAQAINDPESGVAYDPEQNSVCLSHGRSFYMMYHCPFCGGRFPDSSSPMWVPLVPQSEFDRLNACARGLADANAIIQRLGRPDYDAITGAMKLVDGVRQFDGEVRNIEYYNLSDLLALKFYIGDDGTVAHKVAIKLLSPRAIKHS
jgi:hypothetical protein